MLHEGAHALAVVRGVRDTSAEGNRYHNKRFVALAIEMGGYDGFVWPHPVGLKWPHLAIG